ncbi:MAG: hypothetical protein D3926_21940 [Desulfobacteraceae bacterium]|nr:MAG: hypothetical protein D3926_21940 [Desulfobacteraceae bacterium]
MADLKLHGESPPFYVIVILIVFSVCIQLFLFIPGTQADLFHAGTPQALEQALEASSNNQAHDTVKVALGMELPDTSPYIETGYSLTVEAGYNPGFTSRVAAPRPFQEPGFPAKTDSDIPRQSNTGPVPPEGIDAMFPKGEGMGPAPGGTEKTIGVPGYRWRHGCGPTAVGMVVGYYDVTGFSDLFDDDGSTQTSDVNQGIASQRSSADPGHYEDYSEPIDTGQPSPIPDKSENPAGDEHTSDSIADFMETSFSSRNNYYGWSWSSDIQPSFTNYVVLKNPVYETTTGFYHKSSGSLSWAVLTTEIDNNRPMVFLVDTNSDGSTDHFVTVVGYRDAPSQQYGCLDTWSPVSTVRWCDFETISAGHPWGIWGGWSFALSSGKPSVITGSASSVLTDQAILNGTVNPNSSETTCWFEYGLSTAYGDATTPVSAGNGSSPVSASQVITGLLPDTTYYFRLVGNNLKGTAPGAAQTFKTRRIVVPSDAQPWIPSLLLENTE